MENQSTDKNINSIPFPVTPTISQDTLKEISEIEMVDQHIYQMPISYSSLY